MLDAIAASNKLVVGHNMLLDIVYTVCQFYGPLPERIEDGKKAIQQVFPQYVFEFWRVLYRRCSLNFALRLGKLEWLIRS